MHESTLCQTAWRVMHPQCTYASCWTSYTKHLIMWSNTWCCLSLANPKGKPWNCMTNKLCMWIWAHVVHLKELHQVAMSYISCVWCSLCAAASMNCKRLAPVAFIHRCHMGAYLQSDCWETPGQDPSGLGLQWAVCSLQSSIGMLV